MVQIVLTNGLLGDGCELPFAAAARGADPVQRRRCACGEVLDVAYRRGLVRAWRPVFRRPGRQERLRRCPGCNRRLAIDTLR